MSISKMFGMDADVEKNGLIIDYGDFRVKIARAGGNNKKFGKIFQAKMKPLRRQIETDTLDEKVATKVMAEAYAEAVILDMDVLQKDADGTALKNEDGSLVYVSGIKITGDPIEFNRANITQTLIDWPEFFKDLQSQANQVSLFRTIDAEDDVKN